MKLTKIWNEFKIKSNCSNYITEVIVTLHRIHPKKITSFEFGIDDPNRLLAECKHEDFFWIVKRLSQWNISSVNVTSSALAYWAARSINQGSREEVGEIRSLIRRIQRIQPLEIQPPELEVGKYYLRWDGIVDVLESHIHMLDYNDGKYV